MTCVSLATVLGCGGKIAGDAAEQGAGGGAGGTSASDDGRLPPNDVRDPSSDPAEPDMPPPDDVDVPPGVDPEEVVFDRCRDLCELPEVQCQKGLGSSVRECTNGCATTGRSADVPECQDMFFEMLDCLEAVAREVQCRDDLEPHLTDRCSDLLYAHASECLSDVPPPPSDEPGLVQCATGEASSEETSCSLLQDGCSDGRWYAVICRQVSSSGIECDCLIDGRRVTGVEFEGSGAGVLEEICHSPLGFESCGFPVQW